MKNNIEVFSKIIFLVLIFNSLISIGQSQKGKVLVGLNLNGSIKSNNNNYIVAGYGISNNFKRKTTLQPELRVGYFFKDKLLMGLNVEVNFGESNLLNTTVDTMGTTENTNKMINKIVSLNPFLRFYIVKHKNIGIFIEGSTGIAVAKATSIKQIQRRNGPLLTNNNFKQSSSENILNYKLGLGMNYFISDNTAIEFSIYYKNYNFKKLKNFDDLYTNNVAAYLGFNIYF